MRIRQTGKIAEDFYVVGNPIMPVYLLDGDVPVMFDAGLRALAPLYEADIKRILGGRSPQVLFLTHSHFDHIGAAGYFKKTWPDLKIAGSEKVQDILKRPRAVKTIRSLNREAGRQIRSLRVASIDEAPFEAFELDLMLDPGQTFPLGQDMKVVCISSPGHTWDFMSYWIPERCILVASEAVGCDDGTGYIYTEFLVDYDTYLKSLTDLSTLNVRILCPGHGVVMTGSDATGHMARAVDQADAYVSMVQGFLRAEGGDIERTVMRVKEKEWDPKPWPKQIESAYHLNTHARVRCLHERMEGRSASSENAADNGA
ncbi:MAG: MBL fold metallo-hydrolase [Deltaproteobacteria bacterium]